MLHRRPVALPLILVLALVARVGVIIATPHFVPVFDAGDYDRHALSIAHGHGYPDAVFALSGPTAFRPPLYPLALAGVYVLGGGWTAGRVLGALLGVAMVALIFAISLRLWGRRVAIVAGVLAAVFPPLVLYSATLLSEPLFLVLVLAALFATLEYRRTQRLRWAALAGLACGLASLTRSNGVLLVVAAGFGVWILRPRLSRAALIAPLIVVLVAGATVAPWVIRNAIVFHRFVGITTQGGYGLAGTYNNEPMRKGEHPGHPRQPDQLRAFRDIFERRDLDEAARSSRLSAQAFKYIDDHPGYVVEAMAWNTLRVFNLVTEGTWRAGWRETILEAGGVERVISPIDPGSLYLVMLLALAGIAAQARALRSARPPPFIWLFPLLMVLPAIVVVGLPRYRAPLDPFLVMLAAVGIVACVEAVARRAGSSGAHVLRFGGRSGATP
jgi:4-amino-4-deoxy-L-arabinose transferase-like glycosyltransferase